MYGLTPAELRAFRGLDTPMKVQRFLDGLDYNLEPGGATCRSPRRVFRDRTAHCAEGALFAAAAFRIHERPPLIVDLEAERDDDHVLAVYRDRGLWGAVGISKFAGLRFRVPLYRTIRELVLSYFEDYYNYAGERTLRRYSRPVSLAQFDRIGWMTAETDLWPVMDRLVAARHVRLAPERATRGLPRLDRRAYEAGLHGAPPH
ncbi:MAG TPA: hypothetical protein VHG53_04105 [Candidatus Limnocylindria bacterium]|nr:hypothetical protein [Candidatus Limnocylindria bacterium]